MRRARPRRWRLALLVGGRVFAAMKQSLGAGEWVRRALGVLVLAGVVAIAFGLDTGFLARLSLANTARLRAGADRTCPARATRPKRVAVAGSTLPVEGTMPELNGAVAWLNSPPLTPRSVARQGRAGGFLDLFLHQLPALAALHPTPGRRNTRITGWW